MNFKSLFQLKQFCDSWLPPPRFFRGNRMSCTDVKHSSHWHLYPKYIPREKWKLSAPRHQAKKQQIWIQLLPQDEGTQTCSSHKAAPTTTWRKRLKEISSTSTGASLQSRRSKWQSGMRAGKKQFVFSLLAAASSSEEMEDQNNLQISHLRNIRQPGFFPSGDFTWMTQMLWLQNPLKCYVKVRTGGVIF